ncbi:type II secretion system protein [Neptuniibacter sp. SY11_33]|uniref:type II secretion system protein n=1 Tax=Neptuniibacter sp. SY11_33 TaxID=3398215 RepID=UPI0039F4F753
MNAQQIKETIRKFKNADLTQVKDAELRAKGEKLQAKQAGFTLLELLVVVAILAVIAGAVISNMDGNEESAAQATAVHTMATLENSMNVFNVTEKRLLPAGLDSLICSAGVQADYTATVAQIDGAASVLLSNNGNTSNVPRVDGGLSGDMFGKLGIANIGAEAVTALANNGMTSLRYVNNELCNGSTGNDLFTQAAGFDEDVDEIPLVEVTKPSMVFNTPLVEDDDWEFGAGAAVDLTGTITTETIPVALFNEPEELGEEDDAVLAVFGVGPSAELDAVIARAPQDGNAAADKYSNYSIVVKIAECDTGDVGDLLDPANTTDCLVANWEEVGEELEVIAVLDAGGDAYDDEIAEAKGNEEE